MDFQLTQTALLRARIGIQRAGLMLDEAHLDLSVHSPQTAGGTVNDVLGSILRISDDIARVSRITQKLLQDNEAARKINRLNEEDKKRWEEDRKQIEDRKQMEEEKQTTEVWSKIKSLSGENKEQMAGPSGNIGSLGREDEDGINKSFGSTQVINDELQSVMAEIRAEKSHVAHPEDIGATRLSTAGKGISIEEEGIPHLADQAIGQLITTFPLNEGYLMCQLGDLFELRQYLDLPTWGERKMESWYVNETLQHFRIASISVRITDEGERLTGDRQPSSISSCGGYPILSRPVDEQTLCGVEASSMDKVLGHLSLTAEGTDWLKRYRVKKSSLVGNLRLTIVDENGLEAEEK
ncbi:MAG: hypothetical protein M1840_005719 [Geoglossum simile]|nr:MAG: hypothetical protein M1840_005719 [Geoglossum simile]